MWVPSLGGEDPLEEEMATHSSSLAWSIPWTEEPGRLQPIGSHRGRSDLAHKQGKERKPLLFVLRDGPNVQAFRRTVIPHEVSTTIKNIFSQLIPFIIWPGLLLEKTLSFIPCLTLPAFPAPCLPAHSPFILTLSGHPRNQPPCVRG